MSEATSVGLRTRSAAIARNAYAWLQANPLLWSGGLFAVALVTHVAFQARIIPGMELWLDELFSLWAGSPSISFGEAFSKRILPDTNGPIYFSLVYFAQAAGLADRAAFLVINYVIIGGSLALILWRGWRFDMMATALSSVAILLATAPLLTYGPEGRVYGIVMALCAIPAFEAGRIMAGQSVRTADFVLVAATGILAAWMHVFGAIFIGSLAAGMVVVGAFMLHRRDVVVWGLVAGVATSVALAFWLAFAFPLFTGTTSWIEFNKAWVYSAIWELKHTMVGPTFGLLVVAGFVGLSLVMRHSRPLALALVITAFLYFAIPFAVSFKMPIFLQRYLLVGFPALLVLCVFLLRCQLVAQNGTRWRSHGVGALGVLVFAFPIMQGMPTAQEAITKRQDWVGWRPVVKAAADCPAGEIRTKTFIPLQSGFDYLLKGRLKSLDVSQAPLRDVSQIDCPVFAWGEHVDDIDASTTMDQALRDFHLTNTTGLPLVLLHHHGGYVLARADANLD